MTDELQVHEQSPLDALSDVLWEAPKDADEDFKLLHAELVMQMKDDIRDRTGFGAMELLFVERIITRYIQLRQAERKDPVKGGFEEQRNHKEAWQLWSNMVGQMQRARATSVHMDEVRARVLTPVVATIRGVLQELAETDPELADKLGKKFADALKSLR